MSKALTRKTIRSFRVKPSSRADLKDRPTAWAHLEGLKQQNGISSLKQEAREFLRENVKKLSHAQELLYASGTRAILLILQGMDASGKDGTIKHVVSGINPQGCSVYSFRQPSAEELRHDFLWRYSSRLPERGRITIFNRSYYEEVLVTRVHPEWLSLQHLPGKGASKDLWLSRYEDINAFERHLVRNGIAVIKFFLHVSKPEQKRRLLERLEDKDKFWKFSSSDLTERAYWKEYARAYENAITATSTTFAPWYVIPADHKWAARALVAEILTEIIGDLRLRYPKGDPHLLRHIRELKKQLR